MLPLKVELGLNGNVCPALHSSQKKPGGRQTKKAKPEKKGAFVDLADDDDGGLEYRETRVWFCLEVECINAQETQLI